MDDIWTEIVAKPDVVTSGRGVSQLVHVVSEAVSADCIFAEGIDGAGVFDLPVNVPISIHAFLSACDQVKHFDWADLYLLDGSASKAFRSFEECSNYSKVISQSRATVRVVDGEYVYIYSRAQHSATLQQHLALVVECTEGKLTDFVFPT